MARLSEKDEQAVAALAAEAGVFRLGQTVLSPSFVGQLTEVLRARVGLSYELELRPEGPRVARLELVNANVTAKQAALSMDRGFERQPTGFVGFSPMRPAPGQRNRAIVLCEIPDRAVPGNATSLWRSGGVEGHDQVRVLVCENEAFLAWVGAYRPDDEPFTARERLMLQRLVPALRRRLVLEQQLKCAPLARAALEACIEALPRPAMIVDARGDAPFANTLARRLIASDRQALTERLKACLARKSTAFSLTPLATSGLPAHWLAIEAPTPRDPAPLLASASRRWALTARETQALALLVDGLSNRAIAVSLGCAERTVEVHVARLLAKSDSESRSQLIARIWSDGYLEKELKTPHVRP